MVGDYDDLGDFLGLVLIDVEVSGPEGGDGAFTIEAPIRIDGARGRHARHPEDRGLSLGSAHRYHARVRTLLPQCLGALGGNHG